MDKHAKFAAAANKGAELEEIGDVKVTAHGNPSSRDFKTMLAHRFQSKRGQNKIVEVLRAVATRVLTIEDICIFVEMFKKTGPLSGLRKDGEDKQALILTKFTETFLGNIVPAGAATDKERAKRIKEAGSGRPTPASAVLEGVMKVVEINRRWLEAAGLPISTTLSAATIAWALEDQFHDYHAAIFETPLLMRNPAGAYPHGATAGAMYYEIKDIVLWYLKLAIYLGTVFKGVYPYGNEPKMGRNEFLEAWKDIEYGKMDQQQAIAQTDDLTWEADPTTLPIGAALQIFFLMTPRHISLCKGIRMSIMNRVDAEMNHTEAIEVISTYMRRIYNLDRLLRGGQTGDAPKRAMSWRGCLEAYNKIRSYFATIRTKSFGAGTGGDPIAKQAFEKEIDVYWDDKEDEEDEWMDTTTAEIDAKVSKGKDKSSSSSEPTAQAVSVGMAQRGSNTLSNAQLKKLKTPKKSRTQAEINIVKALHNDIVSGKYRDPGFTYEV